MSKVMRNRTAKDDWNFDAIKREVDEAEIGVDEAGNLIQCIGLGSVMSIAPSGKYYMPWTTNQTEQDEENDEEYFEQLREELNKKGLSLDNGEDPTDLFACKVVAFEGEWEHKKEYRHMRRR